MNKTLVEGIRYAGQLREWSGAEMPVVVSDEDLSRALLGETRLDYSVFTRCSFEKADLHNCDLENAQFIGCNLRGANFYGSELTGAQFINCVFDDETNLILVGGEWGFLNMIGCTYDYNGRVRQKEEDEREKMEMIEAGRSE